jgi:ABC-type molybdate transport system ATPase subunit
LASSFSSPSLVDEVQPDDQVVILDQGRKRAVGAANAIMTQMRSVSVNQAFQLVALLQVQPGLGGVVLK